MSSDDSRQENKKLKILHIDDNIDYLELFKISFEDYFETCSISASSEVLSALQKQKFDAVITDFEIDEMSGLDVLNLVKENFPNTPVIFYTGQGNEAVARQAFLAGASDYFTKDSDEFLHTERLVNSVKKSIEKVKAQEALEESERRYRFLYNESLAVNVIMDVEGRFLGLNKALQNVLEADEEELIGKSAFDYIVPEQVEEVIDSFTKDVHGVPTPPLLMNIVSVKGNLRKIFFGKGAVLLKNGSGAPYAVLSSGIDMTEHVHTQQILQESQKILLLKNKELEDFNYMISHDLKTQLVTLLGYLQLIKDDPSKTTVLIDKIFGLLLKTMNYNDNLLKLAKLGQKIEIKKQINLEEIINEAFSDIGQHYEGSRLNIKSSIPLLNCDDKKMKQVFANLIENAFEHNSNKEEPIEIDVWTGKSDDSNSMKMYIADNGFGVPERLKKKIFRIGFSTKPNSNSSGFGLAIVKKIIDAHNWKISITDRKDKQGTCFVIEVP